jgi:hypothetical protein
LEGSDLLLSEVKSRHLPGETEEIHKIPVMITDTLGEIQRQLLCRNSPVRPIVTSHLPVPPIVMPLLPRPPNLCCNPTAVTIRYAVTHRCDQLLWSYHRCDPLLRRYCLGDQLLWSYCLGHPNLYCNPTAVTILLCRTGWGLIMY